MDSRLFFVRNFLLNIFIFSNLIFGSNIASAEVPSNQAPRTINVIGRAKISLTPDIAHINFSVHTENSDVAEAVSSNNNLSQQVANTLKKFQIDPKDIQTSNFNIYQQQQYDNTGKPRELKTYTVDNTVSVTLRDINKLGSVIAAAVNSGSNSISGLQFSTSNRENVINTAKKAAVTNAIEQAKELAAAANVTLGNILTISSYQNNNVFPMPMYAEKGLSSAVSSETPISPGQLELSADVNIVFEIK